MDTTRDSGRCMRQSQGEMYDGINISCETSITVRRQPRLVVNPSGPDRTQRHRTQLNQQKPHGPVINTHTTHSEYIVEEQADGLPTLDPPHDDDLSKTDAFMHEYGVTYGHRRCDFNENLGYAAVSNPLQGAAKRKLFDVSSRTRMNVDVRILKARSNLFLKTVSTEEVGSSTTMSLDKPDYSRHKYDSMINPSLPQVEKKKLRRIYANRASARRSRERKKEAMDHLLYRERELIRERDAAFAKLTEQIRISADLQDQVNLLKRQLALAQKDSHLHPQETNRAAFTTDYTAPHCPPYPTDNEPIVDECMSSPLHPLSTSPIVAPAFPSGFTWYTRTENAVDSMDPYAIGDWNHKGAF